MSDDVSTILMDDAETPPAPAAGAGAGTPPKRGRGRPRGSRSRAASDGAGRVVGARELASLLAKAVGGASVLLALFLDTRELEMTPAEANDIAKPAARLLAKSSAAARLLSLAGKSSDYVELTFALATYGLRIWPVLVMRQQAIIAQREAQQRRPYGPAGEDARVWPTQPAAQAAESANGHAGNGHNASASEQAAADAAAYGGLGFVDPDALAAGAYGDVAATVRAAARN